ncbi:MAG: hypothetical protein R2747_12030 [Pyrinomonadaceae bacterium]
MSRDVITVNGEERVVREDTAKAYRGVVWGLTSLGIILLIILGLFFSGFFGAVSDGKINDKPTTIESQRQ